MTHPGVSVLLLLLLAPLSLRAEPVAGCPAARSTRLRTTDTRLRSLMRDGSRFSKTFQSLVDRLNGSDVVVYVEEDRRPREGIDGRMVFIAASGGSRYVMVRVAHIADPARQIAILGHELQHAVEVALAPAVIDAPSLAREYARIGVETRLSSPGTRTFDTNDAIRAGYRVLRELRGTSE